MPGYSSSKQYLTNIVVIRLVLIVLLVFYHAFAIYSGAWEPIKGFPEIKVYWWLDKFSFAFMLEMFVFVSGYVFGYQVRIKGENKLEAKSLFWGKFKRLIVPSMVFGLLYIILLKDISQPMTKTIYEVISGYAHMWFLPMLFWCFVGIWVIEKLRLKPQFVFPLLMLCSLFSFVLLPFQMKRTLYYLLFFYIGYFIQRRNCNLNSFYNLKYVISLLISFFILFPFLTSFNEYLSDAVANNSILFYNSQFTIILSAVLSNLFKLLHASLGLSALFLFVGYIENKRISTFPQWIITVGGLCMGVYLLQQFILKAIYNHTCLPNSIGPYWLPWVGFVVALLLALFLTYIMRISKVGRFLIG